MGLTRRQFLKWAGVTGVGAVVFNGCRVPDHEIQIQSPVELPEDLVTGRDNYYATTAQVGSSSEGLLVRVMEGRAKKVEGNPDYPLNTGKHHIRTETLLQATYHPDRIKTPMVRIAKGGPFRAISWPDALERLNKILDAADPASVLLATGPIRGKLAEVTNRFAKDYGAKAMGYDPIDQTVLRTAIKNIYDQDALPDFDIAHADLILSFGADFLGTWIDPTHFMRGYGEFRQGEGRERGHLVHVDSRYSVTAAAADEWLYVNPGSEGLLALAMAHTIIREGLGDRDAAQALTGGDPNRLARYQASEISARIGMSITDIADLARKFAGTQGRALAIGGGSAGAHTNGVFNLTAIYALNYLVGSVNVPGGVIFNPATNQSQIAGAPARDWKAALDAMIAGDTKVLLVREANIVHGLSHQLSVTKALDILDTIVSFSSFLDETTARADLILPGHTPFEEWGTDNPDVGPGYRTVAFQQPVINRFRDTMAFGDVLIRAADELGNPMPWSSMRDAVRAEARALHATNRGSVTQPTFEEFWKRSLERGGWWDQGDTVSGTPTPPVLPRTPVAAQIAGNPGTFPLHLVPFEGHAVGAGQYAHLPWAQATPDPLTTVTWMTWVELNPKTAAQLNVKQDDVVTLESASGEYISVPVYVNPATPPRVAAVPMGQGHDQYTTYASGRGSNVLDILAQLEDTETGALAWAGTRVRLTKTNVRVGLTKLEGIQEPRQLPGEPVIEVFKPGEETQAHS
jgi:menaquinone reductase, molybdopterin-binding-like subunit